MTPPAKRMADVLALLAARGRGVYHPAGREWLAACDTLAAGQDIPPADWLGGAFLPEAGSAVLDDVACACVAYVMHRARIAAAQRELDALAPYYPRVVAQLASAGWGPDATHGAFAAADAARRAYQRAKLKGA